MNRLKYIIQILKKNTLSQIAAFSLIMIISAILFNYLEWAAWPMLISALILAGYAVVFIIAAIWNGFKDIFDKD
jgi:hypothetical protein